MDLDELLPLERAGWDALCAGTGDDFYGRFMTDDALMVLANGMIMDRAQVVDALAQSPPWARYELADARTVLLDDDAAALVYLGTGYRDGGDPPFVGAMSSVDGQWRLALYQQTPVPQT